MPLLLLPTRAARPPIESPFRPSTEATSMARSSTEAARFAASRPASVEFGEQSRRLADAHGRTVRLIETEGLGHTRILLADQTLDAVVDFVTAAGRVGVPSGL
ncbi:MAG: hypothetical protein JWM49_2127 [Microbacteriaceae bacterium]|nr:hypothetical protein [Microbacteriaceae bacterium]